VIRTLLTGFALAFGLTLTGYVGAGPRALTASDRVDAQRAIERVYWSHRIWPVENPGVKPSFEAAMPEEALRDAALNTLAESRALARLWNRPITPEDLQQELDRMAAHTKDPRMLREIFHALGDDPLLIAETLGRRYLADRRLRDAYARDAALHAGLRARAEAALAACGAADCLKTAGASYNETTIPRDALDEQGAPGDSVWQGGGADPVDLPLRTPGPLVETEEAFETTAVLSRGEDGTTIATARWEKVPFDVWWAAQRGRFSAGGEAEAAGPDGSGESRDAGTSSFTLPLLPDDSTCADDTWTPTHMDGPDYRSSFSAVWTGTEMIVWGGSNNVYVNTGGRYNPSTDTWTPTSTGANVPSGRMWHTAVWTGSEMIVWGGYGGTTENTGGRYNPSTDTWSATSTGANVPAARERHAAVWTGTEMIVWGGNSGTYVNTGGRYNPSTNAWTATSVGANVPTARIYHTAVWTGTVMVVWGGSGSTGAVNTGGRYTPSTNTWAATSVGANVPVSRYNHVGVYSGSQMLIWGGSLASGYTNTGGRYNPSTNAWTVLSVTGAPAARAGASSVWTGSQLLIWGGNNDSGYTNTGGRYNPASDAWTATSTGANVPPASGGIPAVWSGTEMLFWLGGGAAVGRYDPGADAWSPASNAMSPSPRGHAAAVWTGAEMIVWGGGSFLDSGGRYVPATDSWTATSRGANVPAARTGPTAVWTGTRMIVWGGQDNSGRKNTGGLYDPATDTWTRATAVDAGTPSGRSNHTAVWTGSAMIVWGGSDTGPLGTGGRYDPVANAWSPTSTAVGAPAARYLHSAVWTGSRMIVWGGITTQYDNTGARYDPVSDSWSPTSLGPGVPTPRGQHGAVWTGSRMLVWGGVDPLSISTSTNTGSSYDAGSDTWTPIQAGPNAFGAYGHTSFWTGNRLLVWGGQALSGGINLGGRYDPVANAWTATSTGPSCPTGRAGHSSVWTGTRMIVWGGSPTTGTGGVYCGCATFATVYRDADGDGYGDPGSSAQFCAGYVPAGYVLDATDCNDANASVHPGAPEVCDGSDNDCDTVIDDVPIPPAVAILHVSRLDAVTAYLAWPPGGGGPTTGFDVVRGDLQTLAQSGGDFTAATTFCVANDLGTNNTPDPAMPAPGSGFWYLVRATSCAAHGTYDSGAPSQSGSRDAEIAASGHGCP